MKNQLKTVALLGVLSVIVVAIGGTLGRGQLALFGAIALAMNFVAYFWSDKIVLRMSHARELGPNELPALRRMVTELSQNAGIPAPRIYITPEAQPNAFATGRSPEHGAVAFTQGILNLLDERELRGVTAHELAHIANRDVLIATIAAAVSSLVTYVSHAVQWGAMFGGGRRDDDEGSSPLASLAIAILAPIAATLVQLAISRSREYLADETAARLTGDPEALARALEKLQRGAEYVHSHAEPATASLYIVNPFAGVGGLMGLFSTHPPMGERVRRLRALDPRARAA